MRMKGPVEYRRVRDSEENNSDEPYLRTWGSNGGNTCLLSSLLLLLIVISISLALTFFITSRHEAQKPFTTIRTTAKPLNISTPHQNHHNSTIHQQVGRNETFNHNHTLGLNQTGAQEVDNLREQVVHFMRTTETLMEHFTGMEGELLVPILMLLVFLTSLTLVSLCCCFMSKRRESRRRKLFGKIITDLQTGDSKTVLLSHSDLDD